MFCIIRAPNQIIFTSNHLFKTEYKWGIRFKKKFMKTILDSSGDIKHFHDQKKGSNVKTYLISFWGSEEKWRQCCQHWVLDQLRHIHSVWQRHFHYNSTKQSLKVKFQTLLIFICNNHLKSRFNYNIIPTLKRFKNVKVQLDFKKETSKSRFETGTRNTLSDVPPRVVTNTVASFSADELTDSCRGIAGTRRHECETTHCIQALARSRSLYSVNCICCIIRLYKMLSDERASPANGEAWWPRLCTAIGPHECWNLIYKGDFFENQFLCYRTKLYWMRHKKHNYVCYSRRGFRFFLIFIVEVIVWLFRVRLMLRPGQYGFYFECII